MKVSVYDTYVLIKNNLMHFDILVEEKDLVNNVYKFGKEYLKSKGLNGYRLSTKECNFCHIEIAPDHIKKIIEEKGYYIIEMENC